MWKRKFFCGKRAQVPVESEEKNPSSAENRFSDPQFGTLARVQRDRVPDHGERLIAIEEVLHDHGFILEHFVIEKKSADLFHSVLRQIADRLVIAILRIVDVDGDDLVVFL